MKTLLLFFSLGTCLCLTAQTVNIPDPYFEQALIDKNIDSDEIVNGLVLLADVVNVTELTLGYDENPEEMEITSLAGLEAFSGLESLAVTFTQITSLNLSQNTQLKYLNCSSNMLASIDFSANILLESLILGNSTDLAPFNEFTQVDLSNNPNIKFLEVANLAAGLDWINLKNGNNNPDMTIQLGFALPYEENTHVVCIEVDNAEAAQNNEYPYSEWDIDDAFDAYYTFTENCSLRTNNPEYMQGVKVYPNPASNIIYLDSPQSATAYSAQLYDVSGRMVREYVVITAGMDVSALAKGLYVLKISNGKATTSHKIIVE